VSRAVRALRGATTVDANTREQIFERVPVLLTAMFDRNGVHHDDIISLLFTATDDVDAAFPAEAARTIGLGDVPLMCAREIPVPGSTSMCIRVLAHIETGRSRAELHHVYLERAKGLRDDLPE
jgi:chorismate mutase